MLETGKELDAAMLDSMLLLSNDGPGAGVLKAIEELDAALL